MVEKDLLKRYFENRISDEEKERVEKWLTAAGNKDQVEEYILSSYALENEKISVVPFEEFFAKIKNNEHSEAKVIVIKQKWIWAASAACVLFLLLGGWLGYRFNDGNAEVEDHWVMNTAETNFGQYAQLTLSDGSEVYLAGNSKISFPEEMNRHPVVYLEGEAYFDVQNIKRGITVKTKDLVTTAKDSKFNISAFSKDSVVTVTVETGKAEVRKNNEIFPLTKLRFPKMDSLKNGKVVKPKIVKWAKILPAKTVNANEQATYDKSSKTTDISEVKPGTMPLIKLRPAKRIVKDQGFSKGLKFYEANIEQVINKLESGYNLKIELNINEAELPPYTGEFEENVSISEVLKSICYSLGLEYTMNGATVYINRK